MRLHFSCVKHMLNILDKQLRAVSLSLSMSKDVFQLLSLYLVLCCPTVGAGTRVVVGSSPSAQHEAQVAGNLKHVAQWYFQDHSWKHQQMTVNEFECSFLCFLIKVIFSLFRLLWWDAVPDVKLVSVRFHITTCCLDYFIQITLDELRLVRQTWLSTQLWNTDNSSREVLSMISAVTLFNMTNTSSLFWRPKLSSLVVHVTHPGILALKHVDLRDSLAAFLHSYCQQRVVGTAVQYSTGLRDGTQRQRLQLCL